MRSFSPSLILTCTLMVSPGRKGVRLVRRFFSTNFDNNAFCISENLICGLNHYVTTVRIRPTPSRLFDRKVFRTHRYSGDWQRLLRRRWTWRDYWSPGRSKDWIPVEQDSKVKR